MSFVLANANGILDTFSGLGVWAIVFGFIGLAVILFIGSMLAYKKVDQGEVLIVNLPWKTDVHFTGGFIWPVITRAEVMDISVKTIQIARDGHDGLICADNIRADITVTFFVKVNRTERDVKKVAEAVGCARASDQDRLEELFTAKFSEALKTVGKQLEFEELYGQRVEFREQIIEVIGEDLNGYVLEDAAIDYLEQTPARELDPENVLDARGLEKITEITAEKRHHKNELENKAKKDIGRDDLETRKALLEYERQEADAEAKQRREISVVEAQQKAEAEEIRAKEIARAQKAEIEAQEEVEIRKIESQREQEVATKNRERVLAVEEENVKKERDLQVVERERETELKSISRDREVETEQKEVAEVRRDRIAVEKTVAEEEEEIETLRTVKAAEREKEASVIAAEGEAQEALIADIKEAEAKEKVAEHEAKEQITRADAEVDAAERIAKAKKQRAEGVQAEQAAPGLAEVEVKEANAQALEKEGLVEAKITREQLKAEAAGEEEREMVQVRVKKQNAEALEQEGLAEAKVTEEKGTAEAVALREQKQAEADGVRASGEAEAHALAEKKRAEAEGIQERLLAEAKGLAEKAKSIDAFSDHALEHEEYRLQLEYGEKLGMEKIGNAVDIAQAQADVLGKAMTEADINIVGGNDDFYQNFMKSISAGHMIEGFMDTSPTAEGLVGSVVDKFSGGGANGGGNALPVGDGANGEAATDGAPKLTLSKILDEVKGRAEGEGRKKIDELIELVQGTELDTVDEIDGEDASV